MPDTNCGPQSEMILLGNPNRLKTWFRIIVAVASAVAPSFEQGTKIIPFIRPWSTMEKIESSPRTGGRSVIKSIEIWAKGRIDVGPGIGINASFDGCRLILNCWQKAQPFT